jgi:hypothetical protein
MRCLAVAALGMLVGTPFADATRTSAACVATQVIAVGDSVVVDQLFVSVAGGDAEVIVEGGGFSRVLRPHVAGEHALRFYPGLRGDTFRVSVTSSSPRSSCVQEVRLGSGPRVVASVKR